MWNVAKHLQAVLILPFNVAVVIPYLIARADPTRVEYPTAAVGVMLAVACLVGVTGVGLLFMTNRLFMRVGKGTLAPWTPTQELVATGIYRHVRNPMISGVICILLSEVLIVRSPWLAGWLALFAMTNFIFIPLWEEPDLAKRFGDSYLKYKSNVPRWIPRLTPWGGDGSASGS